MNVLFHPCIIIFRQANPCEFNLYIRLTAMGAIQHIKLIDHKQIFSIPVRIRVYTAQAA
jgi:hypothetical protein